MANECLGDRLPEYAGILSLVCCVILVVCPTGQLPCAYRVVWLSMNYLLLPVRLLTAPYYYLPVTTTYEVGFVGGGGGGSTLLV
jgi:hypothetical protein